MTLWSWAKASLSALSMWYYCWYHLQGLEDEFDGANRKNLRHFIQQDEAYGVTFQYKEGDHDITTHDGSESDSDPTYYYMPEFPSRPTGESKSIGEIVKLERKKLQRIPTCAVFHKIAEGKGVPHTFIGMVSLFLLLRFKYWDRICLGFVRQWPALPRVVVCLVMLSFESNPLTSSCRYSCRCASYPSQGFLCKTDMRWRRSELLKVLTLSKASYTSSLNVLYTYRVLWCDILRRVSGWFWCQSE